MFVSALAFGVFLQTSHPEVVVRSSYYHSQPVDCSPRWPVEAMSRWRVFCWWDLVIFDMAYGECPVVRTGSVYSFPDRICRLTVLNLVLSVSAEIARRIFGCAIPAIGKIL